MDEVVEVLLDGLIEAEASGGVVTWNGTDYPVAGGSELGGKLLGSGGFRITAEVTLVLRRDLFGTAIPQEKQRISYTSAPGATPRTLRIDTRNLFRNALLILECNDVNQNL